MDGLSRWLCRECTERVEEFTKFRHQYEETSTTIINLLQGSPTKEVQVEGEDCVDVVDISDMIDNYEVEAIDETLEHVASPVESCHPAEDAKTLFEVVEEVLSPDDATLSSSTHFYQCESCDKVYKHNNSLARHVQTAHQNLRHCCTICSTTFTQKSSLHEHMRCVHKDTAQSEQFTCELCDKSFNSKKTLRQHMKIHSSDELKVMSSKSKSSTKQYRRQCPICGIFFRNVEEHKLTHQSEHSSTFLYTPN